VNPIAKASGHEAGVLGGDGADGGERSQGILVVDIMHVGLNVFVASTGL